MDPLNKRQLCQICLRPLKTCLCKHVQIVHNQVELIILQHPLETSEAKNSGRLLHLCLNNSQLHIGEHFNEDFFAGSVVNDSAKKNILLYPKTLDENSMGTLVPQDLPENFFISDNASVSSSMRLWVLDATWRKSRKMLYLNPALQRMPRLTLEDCPPSIYKIRKAHSENQLSTLEASCYALRQLEQNLVSYAPILDAFSAFIAEQESFIPFR